MPEEDPTETLNQRLLEGQPSSSSSWQGQLQQQQPLGQLHQQPLQQQQQQQHQQQQPPQQQQQQGTKEAAQEEEEGVHESTTEECDTDDESSGPECSDARSSLTPLPKPPAPAKAAAAGTAVSAAMPHRTEAEWHGLLAQVDWDAERSPGDRARYPFLPAHMFRKTGALLWHPPPVEGGGSWRNQPWRNKSQRYGSRGGRYKEYYAAKYGRSASKADAAATAETPPPRSKPPWPKPPPPPPPWRRKRSFEETKPPAP